MVTWLNSVPFWIHLPALLVEILVLFWGGDRLVAGAVGVARRFRVSRMAIGATVVALGTSLPELLVSLMAALGDHDAVATGNVLGSNVANVGLVLGAGALFAPVAVRSEATRGLLVMYLASTVVLAGILWFLPGETLTAPLGLVMLVALGGVIAWLLRQPAPPEPQEDGPAPALPRAFGLLVLGGVLLYFGAETFVTSAVVVAGHFGASDLVIGVTVVAVGTSLPELATTVVAAARNEDDVGVGNVVGSNLFNLLLILGSVALVRPLPFPLRSDPAIQITYGVMFLFGLLLLPVVCRGRAGRRYGALLVGAYVLALVGYTMI
jgi:cation:H+ antiporter